jgi:hypothetical protein
MTQIKLIFSIYGDLLNAMIVSEITKLQPTEFWSKGDLIPNRKNGLLRKETSWQFSSGFIQTTSFEDVSNPFIESIKPNLDMLAKYISENNLETKVDVVIEILNNEKPSLYIDKNFLEILLRLNGEIDVDLYLLEE